MKKIVKRISIAVGVILVVVIALHIALFTFINAKGRDFIIGGLKDNLGIEATMGSLSLKFPFNVEIKDFECETLSFKRGNISLGFFNPFIYRLSLNTIYLDGLDLKAAKDRGGIALSLPPSEDKSKAKEKVVLPQGDPGSSKPKTKKFSLVIGNFYLKNSRIEVNYPLKKRPFNIIFSGISLRVKGFTYPKLSRFYVKLDTVLVSPSRESQRTNALGIAGWVDYRNKNMDIDINLDDFDYIAFGKYYPHLWRPNNLRLKEAVLSFRSNLKSKDNNLIIDNLLTIEGIEFIEEEGEEEFFQAETLKTVISFLKGDKDKPTLRFKVITRMDSPGIDLSSLKKSLMEAVGIGPLDIIKGAADKLKEKVEGLEDATVGSVIEALKGVAGTIEEILKTESEEQP